MIIRPATDSDIPAIAAIVAEAYAGPFRTILPDADLSGFSAAHFSTRFAEVLPALTVVEEGGIAGFAMVRAAHLDMFFIAADRRGRGLGPPLLRAAEQAGARTLECFAANEGARRFYTREGWLTEVAYERAFAGASRNFIRMALAQEHFGKPLPDGARAR